MALKEVLTEINDDVKDIVSLGFELTQTQSEYVPHDDDPGLTFESGKVKKAKLIETCILYADIRKSTELSKTHSKEVMARLYTAFISSVLNIAEHHGGIVRNIIGDRVMIVFPNKNCFTKAIDTAISINTVASRIIDKHFTGFDFRVGIGIDYGQMKVIKAGISKQGKERSAYKNLVWIGNPANIASKLTDVANKEIIKNVFRITKKIDNPKAWRPKYNGSILPFALSFPERERVTSEPLYLDKLEIIDMSPEEFANSIFCYPSDGSLHFLKGEMQKLEKKEIKVQPAPILMSQKVWEEFKNANPNRNSIVNKLWEIQNIEIKEYKGQIIGGNVHWTTIDNIKI